MKRVTGNMKGINGSMDVLSPFDSPSRVKSFLATCNRAWQTEKDRLNQVTFSYPHSHSPTYAHTYTTKHAQPHTISSADYTMHQQPQQCVTVHGPAPKTDKCPWHSIPCVNQDFLSVFCLLVLSFISSNQENLFTQAIGH